MTNLVEPTRIVERAPNGKAAELGDVTQCRRSVIFAVAVSPEA